MALERAVHRLQYVAYLALFVDVFAAGGIVNEITDGYAAVNQESIDRVSELTLAMTNEPSLVEAAANAERTFLEEGFVR